MQLNTAALFYGETSGRMSGGELLEHRIIVLQTYRPVVYAFNYHKQLVNQMGKICSTILEREGRCLSSASSFEC